MYICIYVSHVCIYVYMHPIYVYNMCIAVHCMALPHDVEESCCQAHAWGLSPEDTQYTLLYSIQLVMFDLAVVCLITPETRGSGQNNQRKNARANEVRYDPKGLHCT